MEIKEYGPKYKIVGDHLREKIRNGDYKVGKALPSQNQLIKKYKVSLTTIRQSLNELIGENWIKAEHGRGFFVLKSPEQPQKTHISTKAQMGFVWLYDTNDEASSQAYLAVINGAGTEFKKHRVEMVYARFDPRSDHDNKELAEFITRHDGVIVTGIVDLERLYRVAPEPQRVIIAGEVVKDIERDRFSIIDADTESAGYLAAQYLLVHNHRKLALVVDGGTSHFDKIKIGFQNACAESELPEPKVFIIRDVLSGNEPDEKSTNQRINDTARQIAKDPDITGIVTSGNVYSERLIFKLKNLDCNVPRDKSLVSISGAPREGMIFNNITQIKVPCELIGQKAAKLLLGSRNGGKVIHRSLPSRLLTGDTVSFLKGDVAK